MIDFSLTEEQQMLVETCRQFCEQELYPHEALVETTDQVPADVAERIKQKSIELGLHAANIPVEFGGGGLGPIEYVLMEKELGRANHALNLCVHRPHNILCAAKGRQIDEYLRPAVAGLKRDCIAMTEPDAGSDVRSMKTTARREGDKWIINGTKHFISEAGEAQFTYLFAATGDESTDDRHRRRITCFLVDNDSPGLTITRGYRNVSHRGYHNYIMTFDECVVEDWKILGTEGGGFDLLNEWLGMIRLSLAAECVGRAERAYEVALNWAASRKQFGQPIGKFQGVSFKLADMALEIRLANLLLLECAWKTQQGTCTIEDVAYAKLYCSEVVGRVADEAIQILGGMGLMDEVPLERIWRDARIERIWDGTNEIQRHIISRGLLRPLGA